MKYKIEINLSRKGGEPVWHYLMDDEYSSCEFNNEADARQIIAEESRGEGQIRLVRFTINGIGSIVP